MFHQFSNVPYTFLEIAQGVEGNKILNETNATGIFKNRSGMVQLDNMEQVANTDATIHIQPHESFIASVNNQLIGHGIRVNNVEYRITGESEGKDFDTGQVAFYRLTLKKESFVWQAETPLE